MPLDHLQLAADGIDPAKAEFNAELNRQKTAHVNDQEVERTNLTDLAATTLLKEAQQNPEPPEIDPVKDEAEIAGVRNNPNRIIKIVRYTEELAGSVAIENIINWYNAGTPLHIIIRKSNPGRPANETLSFIDIYAILQVALSSGKVQQRQEPKEELTIKQFKYVLELWKSGSHFDQIRAALAGKFQFSRTFLASVVASLNRRYKNEQGVSLQEIGKGGKVRTSQDMVHELMAHILILGMQTEVLYNGLTQPAIVILLSKVPTEIIEKLYIVNATLAKQLFPRKELPLMVLQDVAEQSISVEESEPVELEESPELSPQEQHEYTPASPDPPPLEASEEVESQPIDERLLAKNFQDDDFDPNKFI